MKTQLLAAVAVLATVIPAAAYADLPGLPQRATPAEEEKSTEHQAAAAPAMPVRGSLFRQGIAAAAPGGGEGETGGSGAHGSVNFIAVTPSQSKRYKKNDIVTVVIQETSDSATTGKESNNKTQAFDMALQQFVQLALSRSGLPQVGTVNNPSSLPEVKFNYTNTTSSDADQERQDSLSARLTGTVVDVKPNGTLVIEAVKQITVDREEQVFKLSGICRVEDIAGDNTILSTQMANLTLSKQTKGEVHDGTKRGWLNQFIDKMSPF